MACGFLTRKQVAERLGISERTLIAWAKEGFGPPSVHLNQRERHVVYRRKVGDTTREYPRVVSSGPVRYPVEALDAWERGLREKSEK